MPSTLHLIEQLEQHHDDQEALRPHITHTPSSTHSTGRAAVAMSSKKHVLYAAAPAPPAAARRN
jgi:hypothetical protein